MKPSIRDHLTILMAFAAVFLCGYGIGHLVGERKGATTGVGSAPPSPPAWQQHALQSMRQSLALRPDQEAPVQAELEKTAAAIRDSSDEVVLEYLQHLDRLYARLLGLLDDEQARHLQREKESLEKEIQFRLNASQTPDLPP